VPRPCSAAGAARGYGQLGMTSPARLADTRYL